MSVHWIIDLTIPSSYNVSNGYRWQVSTPTQITRPHRDFKWFRVRRLTTYEGADNAFKASLFSFSIPTRMSLYTDASIDSISYATSLVLNDSPLPGPWLEISGSSYIPDVFTIEYDTPMTLTTSAKVCCMMELEFTDDNTKVMF